MAAGQPYKGKNVRWKFDGKTLFHATSCALSISTTLEEIATKDTDGSEVTPSSYTWSMTANALVADKPVGSTTQHGFPDLVDLQLSNARIEVEFTSDEAGDFIYSGFVYIESSNMTSDVANAMSGDISFKGTGNLTKAIVA